MADAAKRESKSDIREIELDVSGMSCQGCEQALSMILRQHEAVQSAEANAKSGKVRVRLKRDVDVSELKERIRSAGYEVK